MSLQYLLDGYNLMHQMPSLISQNNDLEDKRKLFIEFIEKNQLQGSGNNKVTIVFDGKYGMWGSESTGKTRVIFSSDETADEKIKKIVEKSSNKKNIVVVTNDRSIKYAVRAQGCRVITAKEFLYKAPLEKSRKGNDSKKGTVKKPAHKAISKAMEHKITSEMEKIWLNK